MKRSFLFTLLLLWAGVMLAQGSVKIILINGVWYQLHPDKNVAVVIKLWAVKRNVQKCTPLNITESLYL